MPATPSAQEIERVHHAQRSLLAHLDAMTAESRGDPTRPSRLPGWSYGHLLTHIAGNARSFHRLLAGAERGERVERYPGGEGARDTEIEQGAGRTWSALVDDVRISADELEAALAGHHRWDVPGFNVDGSECPAHEVPWRREREVLVHHADLGDAGFTPDDWPEQYVRDESRRLEMRWNARRPMGATGLPRAALEAPPRDRLLWLLGRLEIEGVEPAGVF